jgi:hypothetical protein
MNVIYLILLILGAVFFALSARDVVVRKTNLLSLGLLCWICVPLIKTIVVLLHK